MVGLICFYFHAQMKQIQNKLLIGSGIIVLLVLSSFRVTGQDSLNWRELANKGGNFYDIKAAFLKQNAAKITMLQAETPLKVAAEKDEEEFAELTHFNRWAEWVEPRVADTKGNLAEMARRYQLGVQDAVKTKSNVSQFGVSNWQIIGPVDQTNNMSGNGRVNNIKVDPTNPSVLYACTPAAQLFKSTNAGLSWASISDGLPAVGVTDLAIDPTNPSKLYAITGDGDQAIYHPFGSGFYKSTNGGATWTASGLLLTQQDKVLLTSIIIHPQNPNILLVSASNGIYRSTDAGASFTKVSTEASRDLAFQPGNPNIVMAGSNNVSPAVILRSADNGQTWSVIPSGYSVNGRYAIAFSPANPQVVYAWLFQKFDFGGGRSEAVFCSTDAGLSFKKMAGISPNMCDEQGWYDLCLAADPVSPATLYAGGIDIYRSTDSGKTWVNLSNQYSSAPVPNFHVDIHDLVFSGSTLYIANDGGVYKSTNAGSSFSNISANLSIAQPYGIGVSRSNTQLVISGHQDNGTNLTNDLVNWREVLGADGMKCIVDWSKDSVLYASTQRGFLYRSDNGGNSFTEITGNWNGRNTWVTPFKQDPLAPATIYAATNSLYKSVNKGATWSQVYNVITSDIRDFEIDPKNNSILYMARSQSMHKTNGGGSASWFTINSGLTDYGSLSCVHVDANNSAIVYAGATSYSGRNLFRSLDSGATWVLWATGLPNLPVNVIITQKGAPGEVYCGTDYGVYHIANGETQWTAFSNSLPPVPVRDLKIFYPGGKLRAATFGRGVWETPLAASVNCISTLENGRLFVKKTATGLGDGSNWYNAFTSLQDALERARQCNLVKEIWVAAGTYFPDEGPGLINNDRNASFRMVNGVAIYGGFAGNEQYSYNVSLRNFTTNETILSGDIDRATNPDVVTGEGSSLSFAGNAGNALHVIYNNGNGLTSTAVLDGFTISGGHANGGSFAAYGAGMYNSLVSPTIRNCSFIGNKATASGGALADFSSNVTFTDCRFINNMADFGGAIITDAAQGQTANHTLLRCTFAGNVGVSTGGAIIHGYENSLGTGMFSCTNTKFINNYSFNGSNYGSAGAFFNQNAGFNANFTNCLFNGNQGLGTDADEGGGALLIWKGTATIINSTFVNNKAASKGGAIRIYLDNGTVILRNSILWNNSAPEGRDVYKGASGILSLYETLIQAASCPPNVACWSGNIFNQDPLFDDPAEEIYSLQLCSPAIDAGIDAYNLEQTDLVGQYRKVDLKVGDWNIDMGAYERQPSTAITRIYVKADATGSNDGSSWANACRKLGSALYRAGQCSSTNAIEIWVAGGTYYPDEGGLAINNNSNASFAPRKGLRIIGGFGGTETLLSQRNLANRFTSILSGEIQQDNNAVNNSNKVVLLDGWDTNSELDGFTVQQGFTNWVFPELASKGAGITVINGNVPFIRNCIIRQNTATSAPAIAVESSGPVFQNCLVTGNTCTSSNGIIWNKNASTSFHNCTVANNPITGSEYVIVKGTGTSSTTFINSIVRGTLPALSGGNPVANYSLIQNSSPLQGPGNLNSDPQFINEGAGNLHLKPCSPAVNAGTSSGMPTDIDGVARSSAGGVDIGAYERSSINMVYVDSSAKLEPDGSRWVTAFPSFYDALQVYNGCALVDSILVSKGTYPAPPGTPFIVNKTNGILLGGYASGGGIARNPAVNPVLLKGNVQVLKPARIEGVRVVKP
jgi:photosystem II stability/assembly factor-like uncharacterized protein